MGASDQGTLTPSWGERVAQAVADLRERTAVCRRLLAEGNWVKLAEVIGDPGEEKVWKCLAKLLETPSRVEAERQQAVQLLRQLKEEREEVEMQVKAMRGRTLAAILALQRSRSLLASQLSRAAGSYLNLQG
ncbi:MAG: hypothetical protein IMX00_10515 [Limnochordales bacterium]|nr:hypothetical protein [Limnochordales bacterium]